jgi:tRNA-2-methylthio-N6-dimethylallyladenosine synthase
MNVADSELVSTILLNNGSVQADTIAEADVILFNTCSVRQHAEERAIGRISNEMSRKLANPDIRIGVIGCMAQRLGGKLKEMLGGVDFVVGVDNYQKLPKIIDNSRKWREFQAYDELDNKEIYNDLYPTRKEAFTAFITIMRGCDNFCSYCIVPYVRGRERSRPVDDILKEAANAGKQGFRDITLLGQNVNSYNYKNVHFPELLRKINELEIIKRIRFITSHPKDLSDWLIDAMSACPKVCEHIHLPLQAGDNQVLARMNRGYTIEHYLELITKLRAAIPEIAITTDLIAGFPGETEDQFNSTLAAMEKIRFDYAFMFKYSVRTGTKAETFSDSVPESDKLNRLERMIQLQGEITHSKSREQIGREVEVLVEKISKRNESELAGKTRDFKIVVFPADEKLIGHFVKVEIIDAAGWTLKGRLI